MTDKRELFPHDVVEPLRAMLDGFKNTLWTSMPVTVVKDSDGKTTQLQITVKGQDWSTGKKKEINYPLIDDAPIRFAGGGGKDETSTVMTHPVKIGDEGVANFNRLGFDNWFEKGGVQSPIDGRTFHLSDAIYSPSLRSKPRALKNINTDATHIRSVSGKITHHVEPEGKKNNGQVLFKAVDASDKAKDPFGKATKFYGGYHHQSKGYSAHAVDGNKKHEHKITHALGHFLSTLSGQHTVSLHPEKGFLAQIFKSLHSITMTKDSGITHSAFKGLQSIILGKDTITTNSSSKIVDIASQILHNGNTNMSGTLNVDKISSLFGGLTTGAFTVLPDSEGGAANCDSHLTLQAGIGIIGGATIDTLTISVIPQIFASDAAAATGGVQIGQAYFVTISGHQVITVRQT